MTSRRFELPEPVRLRARASGDVGARWVDGLGESVDHFEKAWSIRVGEVLTGGSESLVVTAQCADGRRAVLKLGLPGSSDLEKEAAVFRIADGRGYARLIAHDAPRNALLLERLDRPLAKLDLPVRTQIEVICATLKEAWLPCDVAAGFMTGAEKAQWLANFIAEAWRALAAPCDARTRDLALSFAVQRADAFDPGRSVLVHGDAHAHNALTVAPPINNERPRCKFVDPDGLFAEPACDLAGPMRDWSAELLAGDTLRLARERSALLSRLTGVDEHAIWQWGFIERVSTGLMELRIGMRDAGLETLAVADRCVLEELP